ncbi:MAG: pyridoxamine 5'-phosphate oxidase [bacterium]
MREHATPFPLFEEWYQDALALPVANPAAMVLATVGQKGTPSTRIVLLKEWDESGFVFFTNYGSRKAGEMDANPQASLLFFWDQLGKQVRVEGNVERIPAEQSRHYFQSRPLESQWGAWASRQSQELPDRSVLEGRFSEFQKTYPAQVPLPDFWGGYRLNPHRFEFWESAAHRLHHRLVFERQAQGWSSHLLYP